MRVVWRSLAFDVAVLAGWLASVGLVVFHEHGQLWGGVGHPLASLGATLDAKEQWFGIYYQGQKIGFSQTLLVPEDHDGVPGVGVIDRGRLAFNLLGVPQQLDIGARAFIDANWRLQVFSASVHSATSTLEWAGRRQGDALFLTAKTPSGTVTRRLYDPTGSAFVNGVSSWVAFHRLHVGQYGKAWVINPLALSPEAVYFSVRRREPMDGHDTLVVETDVSGMTTTTWVTPEGDVLKETSPLGWELRQEPRELAMQRVTELSPALDLLSAAAVPLDRPLEDPETITRLTLLVEGMPQESFTVQHAGQTLLPATALAQFLSPAPHAPWCLMRLEPQALPRREDADATPSPAMRYQQASLFVQSSDPRIIAKAREIVGSRADRWGQVMALHEWVHRTLVKQLTIGLPSAVDILTNPIGDCHEHTVLFTALARSLGIPTRMVAGLVYQHERFYYHAWPDVWMGGWFAIDPTLGQLMADVTHVGLTEAEDERLMTLGQFIGTLRFRALEVVHRADSPQAAP